MQFVRSMTNTTSKSSGMAPPMMLLVAFLLPLNRRLTPPFESVVFPQISSPFDCGLCRKWPNCVSFFFFFFCRKRKLLRQRWTEQSLWLWMLRFAERKLDWWKKSLSFRSLLRKRWESLIRFGKNSHFLVSIYIYIYIFRDHNHWKTFVGIKWWNWSNFGDKNDNFPVCFRYM